MSQYALMMRERFSDQGYTLAFRQDAPELWHMSIQELEWQPTEVTGDLIDYNISYFGESTVDLSCVICARDGAPLGIWTVSILRNSEELTMSSFALPLGGPMYLEKTSSKVATRIARLAASVALEMTEKFENPNVVFADRKSPFATVVASPWHLALAEYGLNTRPKYDLFVDLTLGRDGFWRELRKSYRSLMNNAERLWQIDLLDKDDPTIWQEFKDLHRNVAGRVTRSDASWEFQRSLIGKGAAFLVTLRDKTGALVGGGYFNMSRDEALYSVAAYDRSLFDKPLGHAVQMKALEYMWTLPLKWYRLGDLPLPNTGLQPDDKLRSIALFKRGFATHVVIAHEFG